MWSSSVVTNITVVIRKEGIKRSDINNIYTLLYRFSPRHEWIIQVNSGNIGPVQWGVAAAQNRAEWLFIKTPETAVICQESQEYFVSTAANLVNVV